MTMTCPKCGHTRSTADDPAVPEGQCPACGVFYFKYLNPKSSKPRAPAPQPITVTREPIKLRLDWLNPIASTLKLLVIALWKFISSKMTPKRLFWLIIVSFFIWQWQQFQTRMSDPEFIKENQERQAREKANCKKDLQCWAAKYEGELIGPCKRLIEKNAKYSAKWAEDWGPKFSMYRWQDQAQGAITYIGDKVQFQNGFGAWQNMIYECDFNPDQNTITGIRIQPGRL